MLELVVYREEAEEDVYVIDDKYITVEKKRGYYAAAVGYY